MRNVITRTICLCAIRIKFCLKNIREHLDVETSCTITLTPCCVDVTTRFVYTIRQSKFWQQLVEVVIITLVQIRSKVIRGNLSHDVCRHRHNGISIVLNLYMSIIITQAKRCSQAVGNVETRLMEETDIVSRRMKQARNFHRHVHRNSTSLLYICGSLCKSCLHRHSCSSHSCRH